MHVFAFIALLLLGTPQRGVLAGTRTGVISGQVRSQSGNPVPGIRVAAMEAPEMGMQDSAVSVMAGLTLTDENGNYRLEDIPVGKYFVVAGSLNDLTYYPDSIILTAVTPIESLNIVLSDVYSGKIQVTVHHAGAATPVADAEVLIQSKSGEIQRQGVTNEKGIAAFGALPYGDYDVSTPAISIADQVAGVTPAGPVRYLSLAVTINPDRPGWAVSLGLLFPATIRGSVRDSDGKPSVRATVIGMRAGYHNGHRTMVAEFTTETNDKGEYELPASPGEHFIRVIPESDATSSADTPENPFPAAAKHAATYYPATGDPGKAKTVIPTNGEEVNGIDIRLSKTYTVTGTIEKREDQGVAAFELISRGDIEDDVPSVRYRELQDGTFEVQGVPAGSWNLFSIVSYGSPARYVTGSLNIDMMESNITGVSIPLNSGELRGKVTGAGGKKYYVTLVPVDTIAGALNQALPSEQNLDAEGNFVFANIPALRYRLEVYGFLPGQYVSDIRSGNRSIFNENIVNVGSELESLEVIVNSGAGAIVGMVENTAVGSRRADARVLLMPKDSTIQNRSLYRTAVIQESGAFSIYPDVPPGDYRIIAVSRLPIGHPEWNPEFLNKYADVTTSISVLPGQTNQFRLRLVPAR